MQVQRLGEALQDMGAMKPTDRWQAMLAAWMLYGGVLRHKHLTRAEVRKVTMSTVHAHCIKGKQRRLRKGFDFAYPDSCQPGGSVGRGSRGRYPMFTGWSGMSLRTWWRTPRWCRRTRSGGLVQRWANWWGSAPSTWRHLATGRPKATSRRMLACHCTTAGPSTRRPCWPSTGWWERLRL